MPGRSRSPGSQQPLLTPKLANSLGIAIVHQHPALLPDMTVAENIRLAVPAQHLALRTAMKKRRMRAVLDEVGMNVHLNDRANTLSIANQHLLEVAKALAVSPKVLILDEPTAPLGKESVDLLFEHVRTAAAEGTAVVYITHRLAEVRLLADRVTVLRDGKVSGAAKVDEVSDDQLLAWIVGRRLIGSTFPRKLRRGEPRNTSRSRISAGRGSRDISVTANRGEIVGVAGVVGNGQSQLLAALAGLRPFKGSVEVNGKRLRVQRSCELAPPTCRPTGTGRA